MITRLDHLVLTTSNLSACLDFYQRILKIPIVTFGTQRYALQLGMQKINIHLYGQEFEPKAQIPTPGSLDLCFIIEHPLETMIAHLTAHQIPIIEGPVTRTGAMGPILSIYLRDPDLNLIEIAQYL